MYSPSLCAIIYCIEASRTPFKTTLFSQNSFLLGRSQPSADEDAELSVSRRVSLLKASRLATNRATKPKKLFGWVKSRKAGDEPARRSPEGSELEDDKFRFMPASPTPSDQPTDPELTVRRVPVLPLTVASAKAPWVPSAPPTPTARSTPPIRPPRPVSLDTDSTLERDPASPVPPVPQIPLDSYLTVPPMAYQQPKAGSAQRAQSIRRKPVASGQSQDRPTSSSETSRKSIDSRKSFVGRKSTVSAKSVSMYSIQPDDQPFPTFSESSSAPSESTIISETPISEDPHTSKPADSAPSAPPSPVSGSPPPAEVEVPPGLLDFPTLASPAEAVWLSDVAQTTTAMATAIAETLERISTEFQEALAAQQVPESTVSPALADIDTTTMPSSNEGSVTPVFATPAIASPDALPSLRELVARLRDSTAILRDSTVIMPPAPSPRMPPPPAMRRRSTSPIPAFDGIVIYEPDAMGVSRTARRVRKDALRAIASSRPVRKNINNFSRPIRDAELAAKRMSRQRHSASPPAAAEGRSQAASELGEADDQQQQDQMEGSSGGNTEEDVKLIGEFPRSPVSSKRASNRASRPISPMTLLQLRSSRGSMTNNNRTRWKAVLRDMPRKTSS